MPRSSTRRGPWLPDEDQTLLRLVQDQGPNNWVRISQHMQHRTPKQCRERYHQNLKPSLNHEPITQSEGEMIEQMVGEMGKRWAEIARRLGNRSDNAVKNWWNGSMNRRKRNGHAHGQASKGVGQRKQPISATRALHRYPPHPMPRPRQEQPQSHPSTYGWPEPDDLPRYNGPLMTPQMEAPVTSPGQQMYDPRLLAADRDHHLPVSNRPPPLLQPLHQTSTSPYYYSSHGHGHTPTTSYFSYPVSRAPDPSSRLGQRAGERPLTSPVDSIASDRTLANAPSLVSDNQSTYSISPKTVPSPRPNMPAPIDTSLQAWHDDAQRRRGSVQLPHVVPRDEGYVSALPASAMSEGKHYLPTPRDEAGRRELEPYPLYHSHTIPGFAASISPYSHHLAAYRSPSGARDTRMHVSSLVD